MATSSLPLLFFLCIASISFIRSSAPSSLCPRSQLAFLDEFRSQYPLSIERSSPLEVSGESLDRELSHGQRSAYYSVLFYASRCPFSRNIRPIFDALSSMFPQIRHLAVEESSALPRRKFELYFSFILFFPAIFSCLKAFLVANA